MQQPFSAIPEITKNLIILNLLMFLVANTVTDATATGLMIHYVQNPVFQPYQLVSSFFLQMDISHLFFNMLVLFMFGGDVERTLGPKRYLFLYLSAGFGANLLNMGADYIQVQQLIAELSAEQVAIAIDPNTTQYPSHLFAPELEVLRSIWLGRALGASGATYGVLFAFATLYPNRRIMLLIPPIPMKAIYLVLGLACIEFYSHMSNAQTGIGHFVHLSGAAIAVGMVLFWRKQGARF